MSERSGHPCDVTARGVQQPRRSISDGPVLHRSWQRCLAADGERPELRGIQAQQQGRASTVVSNVPHDELDALVAEQTAYYRARAGEYDNTSAFDPSSRAELVAVLEALGPGDEFLSLRVAQANGRASS